jgi:hypothetical protein
MFKYFSADYPFTAPPRDLTHPRLAPQLCKGPSSSCMPLSPYYFSVATSSGPLSGRQIVAIVIPVLLLLLLIGVGVWWRRIRRMRSEEHLVKVKATFFEHAPIPVSYYQASTLAAPPSVSTRGKGLQHQYHSRVDDVSQVPISTKNQRILCENVNTSFRGTPRRKIVRCFLHFASIMNLVTIAGSSYR